MIKKLKLKSLYFQTAFIVGFLSASESALAAGGNNFSAIARNVTNSIEELPGLVTGISYLMGLLLGVTGILKLKNHVENPSNAPLKDGAVRLAAGGALFALPIVFESMFNTIGATGSGVGPATLRKVELNVF
jgi:hypothetical protein